MLDPGQRPRRHQLRPRDRARPRRRETRSFRSRSTIITCSAASLSDSVSPFPSGRPRALDGHRPHAPTPARKEQLGGGGNDRPAVACEPRADGAAAADRASRRGPRGRRRTVPRDAGRGRPGTRHRGRSPRGRPPPQRRTRHGSMWLATARSRSCRLPCNGLLLGGCRLRRAAAGTAPAAKARDHGAARRRAHTPDKQSPATSSAPPPKNPCARSVDSTSASESTSITA